MSTVTLPEMFAVGALMVGIFAVFMSELNARRWRRLALSGDRVLQEAMSCLRQADAIIAAKEAELAKRPLPQLRGPNGQFVSGSDANG